MTQLDLAPIGNCAISSLIDRRGRHQWFCFPRLDGDPVFNALVNGDDPKSGFMDVVVDGIETVTQSYLRNTAVVETCMRTCAGEELRIVDFAPRFKMYERNFRPPMIVRRIEPVSGHPRIKIRIRPDFEYGGERPRTSLGSNHVRFIGDDAVLRVTADVGPTYIVNEQAFLLDRPVNLFIGTDESLSQNPDGLAKHFLHETERYWTDWVRRLAIPFEWQEAVIRSAITLKLCSYEETGAIVAALTTSIPEAPHTARNWDYRFCWLRDAYFTVHALNQPRRYAHHGALRPLHARHGGERRCEGSQPALPDRLQHRCLTERDAESLAGFRGMGPVRIGNAASNQQQNDVFGSVILSAAQLFWDQRVESCRGTRPLQSPEARWPDGAWSAALQPDSGRMGISRPHAHPYLFRRDVLGGRAPHGPDRAAASVPQRMP